ncbi:hypothetical protein KS4_19100 [Poriferisphaera corsica]|uniref:SHOCT domain-containing protein n=1 Tax=Poriferisphaera corsica TaxID=2528020 RepID=A0A517YUE8_9BACT|nr:SHOCT domain-containing protein [Poriferisphaera corsica]QDU33851.1 hypothetical protein KS4_19100 [Poriferisphaera corsica]
MISILSQNIPAKSVDVLQMIGIIVGLAIFLGIVAAIIKKLVYRSTETSNVGYTLSDLRDLHKKGELSDDEFAAAKALIIAQGKAALHTPEDSQESDNWDNITANDDQRPEDFDLGDELLDLKDESDDDISPDSSDKMPPDNQ